MGDLIRTTAVWSGAPGLPGYSQFYSIVDGDVAAAAQTASSLVRGFFSVFQSLIPTEVTVTVDPAYQVMDAATGVISSEDAVDVPADPLVGGYVGNWSAQVGVLIEWTTGVYLNGRRLRGRTYLVPLGNVSDNDGTLPGGTVTTLDAAVGYIVSSTADFVVWHRPIAHVGGLAYDIKGAIVRDHAAILRSRMR